MGRASTRIGARVPTALRLAHLLRTMSPAYARFAAQFEARMKAGQKGAAKLLKAHDLKIRELERRHAGFLDAVAKGDHSPAIIKALNAVDAELEALRA